MNAIVKRPLDGEVLTLRDTVRVFFAPHPLRQERHELSFVAGSTIAEIVSQCRAKTGTKWKDEYFRVYLDGQHQISPDHWHRVRPKPGTTLTMRPVPREPISALIAGVASAVSSFSAFIAGAGWFGKLIMAGISFGAKLLLNKLFAPKQPKQVERRESFSIVGSRNQADPWGTVHTILGLHRVVPNYAAPPYTEIVGDDQYLRMLFVVGYGPLLISDIKIGETAIDQFEDVEIEVRQGFPDDEPTEIYPSQVLEEQLSIELKYADGYQRRTTADNITEISIDLTWPQGLMFMDNKGRRWGRNSIIDWRYRKVGDTDWIDAPQLLINRATQDTIRQSVRVTVDEGQYEVEVKKSSPEATPLSGQTFLEMVQWTALRGFRTGQPITFDDPVAVIAIRIRATSQLNGTIDTLNCMASSLVKSWNGDSWEDDQESSNPADVFRHVLQGPANKRPVPDARIDLETIQDWHDYNVASGWKYDKPIVQAEGVYDMLREVAAAGRAVPVFRDGKWSVVWDEQDTPVVQMFTPRNSWGLEAQQEYVDLPHAFRVRFVNAEKGYIEDERIVHDDGYDSGNATKFEGIEFPGVTDADAIWKHARYHIATLRLQPATYTLSVDFEGLVVTRAERVRVAHDVMLVGLGSGRVKAVEEDGGVQYVTTDELLTLDSSDAYQFRFRLADGTFLTRLVEEGTGGELREFPLQGTDDLPDPGDLFAFGLTGLDSRVYRVLGIESGDEYSHRLTLVDDAPAIYDADTGEIPPFDSGVTPPVDPFTLAPTDLRLIDGAHEEDGQYFATLTASWKLPRLGRVERVEVQYRESTSTNWNAAGSVSPTTTSLTIYRLNGGSYSVRVRSIFTDGTFSNWRTSAVYYTSGIFAVPGDVQDFWISTIGHVSLLSWAAVQGTGVTYEIRHSSEVNPTWGSALPLAEGISATSIQMPARVGVYLIKAQLPSGLSSVNAAMISTGIAAIAGLNVVEVITESPAFDGDHDDTEIESGELRLLYDDVGDGFEPEGTYTFDGEIDLGAVYTSRLDARITAYGFSYGDTMSEWPSLASVTALDTSDPSGWQVYLEYRSTDADPIDDDWTEWKRFAISDVTARAFQFRARLFAEVPEGETLASMSPSIQALSVEVDMPDRDIAGEDITVTTSGLRIDFDPPFRNLSGVAVAIQDFATGDYAVITSKDETGFDVIFRDAGGTPVERTMDFIAKGYGVLHAA